jgi:hypothetical protein
MELANKKEIHAFRLEKSFNNRKIEKIFKTAGFSDIEINFSGPFKTLKSSVFEVCDYFV